MDDIERASVFRLLDANRNRAAEALRVVEDVCRFHWNLSGLASDLKAVRHHLFSVIGAPSVNQGDLLLHRDIAGDVGKESASPTDAEDLAAVARRNLERAREALRVIQETARLEWPGVARDVEGIRYGLYSIETAVSHLALDSAGAPGRLAATRVCLLATAGMSVRPIESTVAEAIDAGAAMVQLREKGGTDADLLRRARDLREITARRGAVFIVNDRVDIALLSHADGVHLGQLDLPAAEVRKMSGRRLIVGVSTHSVEQARNAERAGADYIGAGPIFPTSTKAAGELLRPAGLKAVRAAVSIPVFAIGGITVQNVVEIGNEPGCRVAVSSAVLRSEDPGTVVREIRARLK